MSPNSAIVGRNRALKSRAHAPIERGCDAPARWLPGAILLGLVLGASDADALLIRADGLLQIDHTLRAARIVLHDDDDGLRLVANAAIATPGGIGMADISESSFVGDPVTGERDLARYALALIEVVVTATSFRTIYFEYDDHAVPEPRTLLLLSIGLVGLALRGRYCP